jgi:8-oxo-dGTP pyrophosphatase MutT (NUDIX family)
MQSTAGSHRNTSASSVDDRVGERFRPSARALITDPDERVLLLRVRDAVALNAADPVTDYWITVGGGVEPGETFETAIVREIFEETGHVIGDPGPCIWRRRKSLTDAAGVTRASDERYFWCPVSSAEPTRDNLTQYELT